MSAVVAKLWLLALSIYSVACAEESCESCATNLIQKKALARFSETRSVSNKSHIGTNPWDVYDYLAAVHHKSGIYFLHKIAVYMFSTLQIRDEDVGTIITPCYTVCANTQAPVLFMIDMAGPETIQRKREAAKAKGKGLKVYGTVRDPVTMVASAYCYHSRGEEALNVMFLPPGWPEVTMQTMAMQDGVTFAARQMMPMVANMTSLYEKPDKDTYRFDYERATASSENFDEMVSNMLDVLFGTMISPDQKSKCLEAAAWADLRRHPDETDEHTNNEDCEAEARQVFLDSAPADMLAAYRDFQRRLGYPMG